MTPRTHAPIRAVSLVEDDRLLSSDQVARRLGMSTRRFYSYWPRWLALINAARPVRVDSTSGSGTIKFLRSGVIEHMHIELRDGAELSPAETETALEQRGISRKDVA